MSEGVVLLELAFVILLHFLLAPPALIPTHQSGVVSTITRQDYSAKCCLKPLKVLHLMLKPYGVTACPQQARERCQTQSVIFKEDAM